MRISDWSSDVCSSDLADAAIDEAAEAVVIRTIRVDVVVRTATTDEDERRQVRTIAEGVEQIGAECVVVEVGTQLLAGFDGFRRTVQFITETVFTLMTEQHVHATAVLGIGQAETAILVRIQIEALDAHVVRRRQLRAFRGGRFAARAIAARAAGRSGEQTSELQSLMRNLSAVL